MAFSSDVLRYAVDDHMATLTLDRPRRKNALGTEFWEDFPEAVAHLESDDEVRVVILDATGGVFCAGLDLQEMGGLLVVSGDDTATTAAERQQLLTHIQTMQAAFTALADCPKPVLASIEGPCIGAGVDLITACDMRFATTDAVFSVRETRMAMVPDLGTLQRLRGIVPEGHVAELVYTGRDVDAAHAERIGLVNAVRQDGNALRETVQTRAREIAANAPQAVQGAKTMLRAARRTDEQRELDRVARHNAAFLPSNDLQEALTAFFEKRPPTFTGT